MNTYILVHAKKVIGSPKVDSPKVPVPARHKQKRRTDRPGGPTTTYYIIFYTVQKKKPTNLFNFIL
jgi:hypothetical protein